MSKELAEEILAQVKHITEAIRTTHVPGVTDVVMGRNAILQAATTLIAANLIAQAVREGGVVGFEFEDGPSEAELNLISLEECLDEEDDYLEDLGDE
tara:strand:+ start:1108 stop:1398 length:291 start_codon:yes stop_codon:yes gene_type:complete